MCYLLIICDFQTLCPWGTLLTDFLPTKSDFSWEQIHFSSPKPGPHTSEFLYCACKAQDQKPQGRGGPVPRTCSAGCASHILPVYSGAVFSPRRCSWFPWWCIRLSQGGVVPSLLRLQLSTAETTFPGRCWPSALLCPSLRAQTWSRCRRSCCKAWMCFTSPRTWAECFPVLYREQFQLVLLDLSFPWRAKVVSLLPCLCSEWTLKHLQPE